MQGAELIFYTEGHRITGMVETGAQRLSDLLNDPNITMLELRQATYQEMGALSDPVTTDRLTVRKEQMLLVVPLDRPGMGGQVQTQQIHVHLVCPFFTIDGNLHRRPGDPTNISAFIGESARTYIPISEARLSYVPNAQLNTEQPVVLVQARKIQFWVVHRPPPRARLKF